MEQLSEFFPSATEQQLRTALSLSGDNVSAAAQFLLIDDNNNNAAALALPRKLNKEELVEEQQNNHRSDNKRPSGPSMKKEFKKNVWRTDRKT